MSNPEAINKLVKDLTELAKDADSNVQGGAYGLQNISAGVITGGRRRKGRKRKGGSGTRAGGLKNAHAKKTGAYMRKHGVKLGTASKAVAQGKS